MKAEELRIGNWVLCNGLRTIINNSLMKSIIDNDIQWTIEPIILKEDVFEQLGLYNSSAGYYDIDELSINIDGHVYYGESEIWISVLNYAHQLQNLYFALKNEELIIKCQEVKPHSFCETPEAKCTMNYCDDNGCQNRKRHYVEPQEDGEDELERLS